MYEDKSNEQDGLSVSDNDRVLAWTKDVAKSIATEAPPPTPQAPLSESRYIEREPPRVIVNQIVTTPNVVVTRTRPESRPKDEISTKAVIGTVLGATAGAVVAYAMTKSQTEGSRVEQPKRVVHRVIEAPVTYELLQRNNESQARDYSRANSKVTHQTITNPPLSCSHVEELIPRSEQPHHSSHSASRSHVEGATCPQYAKILVTDSGNSKASPASRHTTTVRQSDLRPITEVRSAKDVPLPPSRVTSLVTEGRGDSKVIRSSVLPKESVSQVSIRRSRRSSKSNHPSGDLSGSWKDHEYGDQVSSRK